MLTKRLHLHIEGRVQGVYYRAHTQQQARALQLFGWVRNLPDGGVEVLAEGPEDRLFSFILACRQGPPAARVDRITPTWSIPTGEFDHFEVRYG